MRNNYQLFLNIDDCQRWGDFYFKELFEIMYKEHEINYFKTPTQSIYNSIQLYCGYPYEIINKYLRCQIADKLENFYKNIIQNLDISLEKSFSPVNLIVARRINRHIFEKNYNNIKKGDVISDFGYMSCSLNINYNFDTEGNNRNVHEEILLLIQIPKDANILYLNHISKRDFEQEILLPRNTKLKIKSIHKILFKKTILVCSI